MTEEEIITRIQEIMAERRRLREEQIALQRQLDSHVAVSGAQELLDGLSPEARADVVRMIGATSIESAEAMGNI